MQEVHRLIEQAAATPAPVLIHGETGTGKELVARTLHELSARASGPFVAVNCAAMPETLLESEIFGHERGAFTDARDRREGCFELAHGGTLLLDEVAEMQPGTQAKFLRVLEEGAFRRLGGKTEITVDVRVVAATNKDPVTAVKDGAFREDLYYRLNVFTLAVPPLRQRVEDIPLLVTGFIEEFNAKYDKRITGVDDATLEILMSHAWPGNVRELRNVVERAFIACEGDVIVPRLPLAISRAGGRVAHRPRHAHLRGRPTPARGREAVRAAHPGRREQQQDAGGRPAGDQHQDLAQHAPAVGTPAPASASQLVGQHPVAPGPATRWMASSRAWPSNGFPR